MKLKSMWCMILLVSSSTFTNEVHMLEAEYTHNDQKVKNMIELFDQTLESQGSIAEPKTTQSQEFDLKIKYITNDVLLEPIMKNTQQIKEYISKFINTMTPDFLAKIDTKLAALQQKMESDKKEILDKLGKITTDISDKRGLNFSQNEIYKISNSQESENGKILEKPPELEKNIKNTTNISDDISEWQWLDSALSEDMIKDNDPEDQVPEDIGNFCDIAVPKSVEIDDGVWKYHEKPAKDALDNYMTNITGCRYKASRTGERDAFDAFSAEINETMVEWRFGVRSNSYVYLSVYKDHQIGLHFDLGAEANIETRVYRWSPWSRVATIDTPGVLTRDRYVWFYLRLKLEQLTIHSECNPQLLKHQQYKFFLPIDAWLKIGLRAYSPYGAKFLYQCPLDLEMDTGF